MRNAGLLGAACLVFAAVPAPAHPGLLRMIAEMTRQIAERPDDPTLYLRRCFYYREHREFAKALADVERAEDLAPGLLEAEFHRARVMLDGERYAESVAAIDRYLKRAKQSARAWTIRARAQRGLGRLALAAEDFARALKRSASPDVYKERGDCLLALGRFDEVIKNYEDGLARLHQPIALVVYLVEAQVAAERYDQALARIDATIARLPRAEPWLLQRARVLEKAGREREAIDTYRRIVKAIDALPPGRRGTRHARRLRQRALEASRRLAKGTSAGGRLSAALAPEAEKPGPADRNPSVAARPTPPVPSQKDGQGIGVKAPTQTRNR